MSVFFLPLSGLAWKIAVGAGMAAAAFYGQGRFLRQLLLFWGLSCAFAGCVLGLGRLCGDLSLLTRGVFYADISWRVLLLSAMAAYLVLNLVFRGGARHTGRMLLPALICLHGATVQVTVLCDTGNTLVDPLTGRAVLVVWAQALRPLWHAAVREALAQGQTPPEQLELLHARGCAGGFRLLPYQSVGVRAGMLLVVRSDYIEVAGQRYPHAPVALSPAPVSDGGGYQGLWGGFNEKGADNAENRVAAGR